jgi:hypothetical protein
VGEIFEEELGCTAVQSDDRNPGSLLHAASSRWFRNGAPDRTRGCAPTR